MMMSTPPRKSAKPSHSSLRPLLVAAMLLSSNWFGISPLLAQSATPGPITNQATGSFIDELDNTPVSIESNTVQVTVVEVAGITVTNAGSSGYTFTGGIVYFDFVLTNVGNDITQFFIPGSPSTIMGGTKTGDIKIVSYDADGSGTSAAVTLDVTVPSGGGNTGTLLGSVATANKGVIPAGATIRIRVPITITATSGNVDVTMGDTVNNGQNEAYTPGNKDIYTVDNLDTLAGETAGAPANGAREASLKQSLPISITSNTPNVPTLTCSSDRRILSTAYNGDGGFLTTGVDTYWDSAIGTASGPPPTTGWIDAFRTGKRAKTWIDSDYKNAGWISHFADTNHQTAVGDQDIDIYFRYQFNLDPTVDVKSFQVMMDFFGDNSIADIFVNGISQKSNYSTVLPQGGIDPYQFLGYTGAGKAALTLTKNWQPGANEMIVQVKSGVPLVGLVAQSVPSYLCKSDAGDAPISYGTAPHQIVTNPKVSLGSIVPDADPYLGQATSGANGDNADGNNDEDAVTTALKVPIAGNYNLSVPVVNTSGGSATLHSWIDFNKNGIFELGEYQSVAVANNVTTANLNWTVPSGTTIGSSFARFRLTTTTLTDSEATTEVDERSTISANDGEVEDYSIDLVVGNPNLLLVKRITAINGLPQKRDGGSLANYENDATNPYDDNNNATPIAPNLRPTTNKWPLIPSTPNPFLIGAIDGGTIKPADSIEYTIYFLSTGDIPAKKVLFCDRVPENVTFIPTAFNSLAAGTGGLAGADRGIAVNLSGTINSYTNIGSDDFAQYFPPNTEPSTVFPKIVCNGTNTNGAVVVNLGNITNATATGTPGSYGFVRFQGQVK